MKDKRKEVQWRKTACKACMFFLGLTMFSFSPAFADNASGVDENSMVEQNGRTVTVVVTDEAGPVIGANVLVKGTTNGATTDLDGRAVISNVPSNAVLVVSYIGYTTQEISVGRQTRINVVMKEDSEMLQDVVVVGYGSLQKKQVTSSITSLKAEDMLTGVSGSDITTALQGKISGLVMDNSGSVNAGTTIQLRGMTSINAGRAPLVVIDGFAGGDIRSVNQEDIKSIDVLKDGSAGAIYGTRAASGVILITTKSGSDTNGKLRLNYSNEFTHRAPFGKPDMLDGDGWRAHLSDIAGGIDYGDNFDWWDEMLNKNNFSQRHHVSMDYGTQKAKLYVSFSYGKSEGVLIDDERTDYSGRINGSFKFFDDWLEIRPSVDYRQAARNNNAPNIRQGFANNPTRSAYDENSVTGYNVWLGDDFDYNVIADAALSDYYGLDKWFKPEVNMKLNIKAIPGLSYDQIVGYENRQWENHTYRTKNHRAELNNSRTGRAYLGFSKTENITAEGYFTYIHEFKGGHNLNAVAGYSYFERNGEGFNMTNYNFTVDKIKYWDMGQGTFLSDGKAEMSSSKDITQRLFSWFGRVNYSYQDKYLLGASIRHEGSSKFASKTRWGDFWAVNAGWRISNEEFMKNVEWVNDLKIRFGYGVTGNNDFSSSYMANLLGSDTMWMLPNGEGWWMSYGKTQNVNPELGWEEKKEWNIGIDYSLFNNRLYGKFDVYRRKIDNMLYSVRVPQPPYTQDSQWQNIGAMESKGWEFEIGGDIIRKKDFTWNSELNLSHNSGKILTIWGNNTYYNGNGFPSPGTPGDAARIEEGAKIGQFYIWKFAGFDQDGNFELIDKNGEVIPASKKSEEDKYYQGNYLPALIAGWTNKIRWKNLDVSVQLRSWIDFDVYNSINMYYGIQNRTSLNVLKDAYGKFNHIRGEKQICDYYLEDGTFLKIQNITVGYTFPMSKVTKGMVDRIRLYFSGNNLATFTGYSGLNPEVNITGWDQGTEKVWSVYPQSHVLTFGMQFNF